MNDQVLTFVSRSLSTTEKFMGKDLVHFHTFSNALTLARGRQKGGRGGARILPPRVVLYRFERKLFFQQKGVLGISPFCSRRQCERSGRVFGFGLSRLCRMIDFLWGREDTKDAAAMDGRGVARRSRFRFSKKIVGSLKSREVSI